MKITDYIKSNITLLDGAMGTMLQRSGLLKAGELPEKLNYNNPDAIEFVHLSYLNAGANVINTNTFGANILKFSETELEKIIFSAVSNAKNAVNKSSGKQNKYIALDIGPTGRMLKPYGDLSFNDAVKVFSETVKSGVKNGVDLFFIETMNDLYETKAALLAVKENSDLPVFVSNAYGEDGKLLTGASPAVTVSLLEGMGADALGVNCSLGPQALSEIIDEYLKYASIPVILKPNAGLPKESDGKTVYDIDADDFVFSMSQMIDKGVGIVGGCCGTTPEYIAKLNACITGKTPADVTEKEFTVVSSFATAVFFDKKPVLIGERINPTGKKRFKQSLHENDIPYILSEAVSQEDNGADILDVNIGLPDINEEKLLPEIVTEIQTVTSLPLQIDTSSVIAMENALRVYNGKAMINSVNGKKEVMETVFPLAKKYGGVTVALTIDENGIPETAQGRLAVAKKILSVADIYGIKKKEIIFDPLAMAVSAKSDSANVALETIRLIERETGCKTVLGISNISFGLPLRSSLNSVFFTLALYSGLSAAIINPNSNEMMSAYRSYMALNDLDPDFTSYISFAEKNDQSIKNENSITSSAPLDLKNAVIKGLKQSAAEIASKLLETMDGLEIINSEIIPGLNEVGIAFENKKLFLPQLLISAETAAQAFEVIKSRNIRDENSIPKKCRIILLTVKGDIHDIGKNIVKLLLQNFGFEVIDLGKDVTPQDALNAVLEFQAPIIGLSALMTTTVQSMKETIELIRKEAPWCKIIVGGAVLTEEYASAIGADKYAADAMETVRYANEINDQLNN